MSNGRRRVVLGVLFVLVCSVICTSSRAIPAGATGINLIQHVIVITQENRSFDQYFGTFPGADGFPAGVCVPDPATGSCVKPYHDPSDIVSGGPHGAPNALADIDGGKMDGFVAQAEKAGSPDPHDVMSYKDKHDIPNYWKYAKHFVLLDHLYEPNASWSLPAHLYMVSGWSAKCTSSTDPSTCTSTKSPAKPTKTTQYPWTDLTYLLHKNNVNWGYFVMNGSEPDCVDDSAITCTPGTQDSTTPSIWNPLPDFETVKDDGQSANIQSVQNFYTEAKSGTLPAVSWVDPSGEVSEHPPSLTSLGQTYVTSLINAVSNGPDWGSSVIFLDWDDWGGFYDQVDPPTVDANGFGLRVPGIIISPFAKRGIIDHQSASFDGINKFIEDVFLNSQRIDPATDGRPDPRPDVRESLAASGNLIEDLDFNQKPRAPLILSTHPKTDLAQTLTGPTTCTVGSLHMTFSPPLSVVGSSGPTTVTVTAKPLEGCTTVTPPGVLRKGAISALTGSLAAGASCAVLAGSTLTALSGGTVSWSPKRAIDPSDSLSFPAGTLSASGSGTLALTYSGGKVVFGSFTNTGASSLRATSAKTASVLRATCASGGLDDVSFSGTVTL